MALPLNGKIRVRSYGVPPRDTERTVKVPIYMVCEAGKGIAHQMSGIIFHIRNSIVSPKDKSEISIL